jgi:hypothetical protein
LINHKERHVKILFSPMEKYRSWKILYHL